MNFRGLTTDFHNCNTTYRSESRCVKKQLGRTPVNLNIHQSSSATYNSKTYQRANHSWLHIPKLVSIFLFSQFLIGNTCSQEIMNNTDTTIDFKNSELVTSNVKNAYSQSKGNIQEVIEYINKIPSLDERGLAYKALIAEMKLNGKMDAPEVITIAFWIKFEGSLPRLPRKTKTLFENLKNSLPTLLQYIFWEQVCIKADLPKEYLYARDDHIYDNIRRRVYTWTGGEVNHQGWWRFYPVQQGKYFKVHNTHYNEYLQASTDEHVWDDERRNVFTVKKDKLDDLHIWKVSIYNLERNLITIAGNNGTEYLYNAYFGEGNVKQSGVRRHVFTWRTKLDSDPTFIWEITPC